MREGSSDWFTLLKFLLYGIPFALEFIGEHSRTRQNYFTLETLEVRDVCCLARLNGSWDLQCSLLCRAWALLRREKEQFIRNLAIS